LMRRLWRSLCFQQDKMPISRIFPFRLICKSNLSSPISRN
jgi:hypothetical protein